MITKGIDISRHQLGIDLAKVVRDNKIGFVVARTTEGTYEDPTWGAYRQIAAREGFLFAGYHKMSGDSSPMRQAAAIWNVVGDTGVPVIIDLERLEGGTRQPTYDDALHVIAAGKGLGLNMARLIYLPGWYWAEIGYPMVQRPVWESDYGPNDGKYPGDASNAWVSANGLAKILQYTDKGRLSGYPDPLDIDAYRGTLEQLARTGWFKDYREDADVTKEEIQDAVRMTPITVDSKGTVQPLQHVLRRILNRPDPDLHDLTEKISDAVVAAVHEQDVSDSEALKKTVARTIRKALEVK